MKFSLAAALVLAAGAVALAQWQQNEPTKKEIAQAYRSKSGEGGTIIPGIHWERWRIREIRGWMLHFKRTGRKQSAGVITLKYTVVARKGGQCADYRITDTVVLPPPNPQMKPMLVVEPDGVKPCP